MTETPVESENIDTGQKDGHQKNIEKKMSPLSTLESSFEALNVKKFDVAFVVDPLYHQTSAQFDEGGAKGLLLNNLGIYGGCRVLFDSLEVPGKCTSCTVQSDNSETIDLSFAREYIEQMVMNMPAVDEISPILREIVGQYDDDNRRPSDTFSSGQKNVGQDNEFDVNESELNSETVEKFEPWTFDHDDQESVVDEISNYADPISPSHHEENDPYTVNEPDLDDRFEKVTDFLLLGLGFTSKHNAWAGPDHWKYRKSKDSENIPASESGPPLTSKRHKHKKQAELDIDFTKSIEKEMPDIFVPPRNLKSILLPANRVPCNTTLPEDCHYQPEDLVKLFLLPDVLCLGKRRRKSSDESRQGTCDFGPAQSWDNESVLSGGHLDGGDVLRGSQAFIATLLFDPSMSALPIIVKQNSPSVGLFTHQ